MLAIVVPFACNRSGVPAPAVSSGRDGRPPPTVQIDETRARIARMAGSKGNRPRERATTCGRAVSGHYLPNRRPTAVASLHRARPAVTIRPSQPSCSRAWLRPFSTRLFLGLHVHAVLEPIEVVRNRSVVVVKTARVYPAARTAAAALIENRTVVPPATGNNLTIVGVSRLPMVRKYASGIPEWDQTRRPAAAAAARIGTSKMPSRELKPNALVSLRRPNLVP